MQPIQIGERQLVSIVSKMLKKHLMLTMSGSLTTSRLLEKKVTITINGKVANEYTEPDNHKEKTKKLGEGTIGIQGHDPKESDIFQKVKNP